ncbi:VanZ family protein [Paracoccaceae bacterium]|nr:VanZ family protein [Paracoccaceae bacterium]
MKHLSADNIADLRTRNIDIYATIIIAVVIGMATLTPVEELPALSGSDKLYHLISFAILTLPIAVIRPKAGWVMFILSVGYGGAIEVLQPLVNRNCELADFLADAGGALLGMTLSKAFGRLLPTIVDQQ